MTVENSARASRTRSPKPASRRVRTASAQCRGVTPEHGRHARYRAGGLRPVERRGVLRRVPRGARCEHEGSQEPDHRVHRTIGLRQDHGAARVQPHARRHPGRARRRQASTTTASTSTAPTVSATEVRRRIGMVFQKPNPFPKSIYDNIAFGPRINGVAPRRSSTRSSRSRCAARRCGTRSRIGSRLGARHVGRPAAAALHRAYDRGRARSRAHGRAVQRA